MHIQRRLKLGIAAFVIADIVKADMFLGFARNLGGSDPRRMSLLAVEVAAVLAFYRSELDMAQKDNRKLEEDFQERIAPPNFRIDYGWETRTGLVKKEKYSCCN